MLENKKNDYELFKEAKKEAKENESNHSGPFDENDEFKNEENPDLYTSRQADADKYNRCDNIFKQLLTVKRKQEIRNLLPKGSVIFAEEYEEPEI